MAEILNLIKTESNCDEVLNYHIGEMEQVLIIGQTKHGEFIAACDETVTIERMIAWMKRVELNLIKCLEDPD